MTLRPLLDVAEAGVREGVAPGVAATVVLDGELVHESVHGDAQRVPSSRPLHADDRFDLASLTKLYVASAAARLVERGAIALDAPAARWLPDSRTDKQGITIRHLLAHASGLPAWRPLYADVAADPVGRVAFEPGVRTPPHLETLVTSRPIRPERSAAESKDAPEATPLVAAFRRGRAIVEARIGDEPLEAAPGTRATYSDLGYIALGFLLERVCGAPLEDVIGVEVTGPLGLADTWYVPDIDPGRSAARRAGRSFVATRAAPARGGAVLCGSVDDDNAWSMGGVAGHAGLFATARDVAAFGAAWVDALAGRSRWLSRETAQLFAARDATPGTERALGWDTASRTGSTLGTRLGTGPQGAIGHLGFTGTSLWIDRDRALVVALLTNHVHPAGADKARMKTFRARFHDAVAAALPD